MVVIKTDISEKGQLQMSGSGIKADLEDRVLLMVGFSGGCMKVISATERELREKTLDLDYTYHRLAPETYKPGDYVTLVQGVLL